MRTLLNSITRSSWARLSMCTLNASNAIQYFFQWYTFLYMPTLCFRKKKTAEFLRDAVETRLRMHIPYIETWPQVCCQIDNAWHMCINVNGNLFYEMKHTK